MLIDVGKPILVSIGKIGKLIFSGLQGREVLDIHPGAEALAFAGDDDNPNTGFLGQAVDGVGHGVNHIKAQSIVFFGPVETDIRHMIFY
jgi:hypothetical protein